MEIHGRGRSARSWRTARTVRAQILAATTVLAVALPGALAGCGSTETPATPSSAASSPSQPSASGGRGTLRDAAPDGVVIGASVSGGGHLATTDTPSPFTDDEVYRDVLATEFSSLTPENQLKWEFVHPSPDEYDFAAADAIVDSAEQNGQVIRGHALLWHTQNPSWLETGDYTADELREILHDHISTVVGRYAGRIDQWDVVNEILDNDGNLRTRENLWLRELGEDVIADAFRWAHEADPDAALFLNDYDVEWATPKREAYLDLVGDLLADGVPVDGFGVQGHLGIQYGFPGGLRATLEAFADLGLQTAITELDVRMELPSGAEPTDEQLAEQADYYRQAVEACLAVEGCDSITAWGVADDYGWIPSFFPGEGAAGLFGSGVVPKPAHEAVRSALAGE